MKHYGVSLLDAGGSHSLSSCICSHFEHILSLQESEGLDRTELESIKRVFERLDRKNDGKIDRDEIAQQFDILGIIVCALLAACKRLEIKRTRTCVWM